MSAGHTHHQTDYSRAFALGIALNVVFVAIEAVFGVTAKSMALMADAGHNLSDVLGLVLAWAGAVMARRAATPRFTYGLKKAPILAALFNALFLLVAVGAILAEAVRRIVHPASTEGKVVILVAAAGIVVNGITAFLFARGRKSDINVRSAFAHMAADALVSIAVVAAGFVILWTGQQWVDPGMSIIVALVVLWGTWGLLKEAVGMTLAGVPEGIDVAEVEAALSRLEGVDAVHDLHVWPLSTTETALTAHVVIREGGYPDSLLENARCLLHDRFHIEHCTIQVERDHGSHHSDC
jgi:cobalt-zinc-cadmium efflux system protein